MTISLEQAWSLLESLNDNANQKTRDDWISLDSTAAIQKQSVYFRKNFSELTDVQKSEILYWLKNDDEFLDYFKCLFGEKEFVKEFV